MKNPFKCAFYAILLSAPIWVGFVFMFIKYRIFGLVVFLVTMVTFCAMAITPFITSNEGKKND